MSTANATVTQLLAAWESGDEKAGHTALGAVYNDLRRLARQIMHDERGAHTLQPTSLLHESYARLLGRARPALHNRSHLLSVMARLMRQTLVDHAVRRNTARRGGGWKRMETDLALAAFEHRCGDLERLDEALQRLGERCERQLQTVELRFFGGLDFDEIAQVLDVARRTVERDWTTARRWLRKEMAE